MSTYDNFNGSSIDAAKWNSTAGVTEGSGIVTLTGNNDDRHIESNTFLSISNQANYINSIIWGATKLTASPASQNIVGMNFYQFRSSFTSANVLVVDSDGSIHDCGTAVSESTREYRIDWLQNGSAKYYIDGVLVFTTSGVYTTAQYLLAQIFDTGRTITSNTVGVTSYGLVSTVETTTLTENISSIRSAYYSNSETLSLTESLTTQTPRKIWDKLDKDSASWTNQAGRNPPVLATAGQYYGFGLFTYSGGEVLVPGGLTTWSNQTGSASTFTNQSIS